MMVRLLPPAGNAGERVRCRVGARGGAATPCRRAALSAAGNHPLRPASSLASSPQQAVVPPPAARRRLQAAGSANMQSPEGDTPSRPACMQRHGRTPDLTAPEEVRCLAGLAYLRRPVLARQPHRHRLLLLLEKRLACAHVRGGQSRRDMLRGMPREEASRKVLDRRSRLGGDLPQNRSFPPRAAAHLAAWAARAVCARPPQTSRSCCTAAAWPRGSRTLSSAC